MSQAQYSTKECSKQTNRDYQHRTYLATTGRDSKDLIAAVAANFPQELRELPQWVTWALPWADGEGRWTKRLRSPLKRGFWASSVNPAHWTDFSMAAGALLAHRNTKRVEDTAQGLGFVLTQESRIVVIDLDHCMVDGAMAPDKLALIRKLNSFTEISLSGDGVHIFVRTSLILPKGVRAPGIEVYPCARFITVSGNRLDGTPAEINDATEWLSEFYEEFAEPDPAVYRDVYAILEDGSETDDDEELAEDKRVLRKAKNAVNGEKFCSLYSEFDISGYPSQSEADFALLQMLAFWCQCDPERMDRLFRASSLMRDKWDRITTVDKRTYGQYSIARAIDLQLHEK